MSAQAAGQDGGTRRSRVVSHPVFGEGEVVESRWRGTELLVRFQSGLRLWLPVSRVRLISHVDVGELEAAVASAKPLDHVQACRMVEAFRLGIVPRQDVDAFTFGRESAMTQVDAALDRLERGEGDSYIVEGEYGTGKTHLLECILHRALERGMAATGIRFDPLEVSPHRPKRVYRELVHNLRYVKDGREQGFRDLLGWAATGLRDRGTLADHVFFGPVLRKLARTDSGDAASEALWQWVEGESTKDFATERRSPFRVRGGQRIPALYDFSTAADYYCNIVSGISCACREAGLKGLVLLIDEAETVTRLWDIIYLTKSVNFMDGLVRTAQNDPDLKRVNPRMIHNQVRPVPYIYREPSLLFVFATTPAPYDYAYIRLANRAQHRIELDPLSDRALVDAFTTMVMVYRRAYPGFDIPGLEQKRILGDATRRNESGVRLFIKFCVEALDVRRLKVAGPGVRRTA